MHRATNSPLKIIARVLAGITSAAVSAIPAIRGSRLTTSSRVNNLRLKGGTRTALPVLSDGHKKAPKHSRVPGPFPASNCLEVVGQRQQRRYVRSRNELLVRLRLHFIAIRVQRA